MKRLMTALLVEPFLMVSAAGWRYQQHRRHKAWCEGYRAGYRAGLNTARKEQETTP